MILALALALVLLATFFTVFGAILYIGQRYLNIPLYGKGRKTRREQYIASINQGKQ